MGKRIAADSVRHQPKKLTYKSPRLFLKHMSIKTFLENAGYLRTITDYLQPIENDDAAAIRGLLASEIVPAEERESVELPCSIDPSTIDKCLKLTLPHLDQIYDCESSEELHVFDSAKQKLLPREYRPIIVFSHSTLPDLILKILSDSHAKAYKENLDHVRKIFARKKFQYCCAPEAELAKLPGNKTLLVMQKATGVDAEKAKDTIEKEFELIPSNGQVAEKWRATTREVADAVALTGYWDACARNFIWDASTNRHSFIDFDEVFPSAFHKREGLFRLVDVFPYQFVDEIYAVALREKVALAIPEKDAAKTARQAQFELSRLRSEWNKQKLLPRVLDKHKWEAGSLEREILDKFDLSRNDAFFKDVHQYRQTELLWDLLIGEEVAEEQHQKERASLESAMERLRKAGDLLTWRTRKFHNRLEYTLYF